MKNPKKIAVLGAGIMGSSTSLLLARAGCDIQLFDAGSEPFTGASRWSEGKIHLGFMYAADPSLNTARQILTGGLAFAPMVESLIGCPLRGAVSWRDDIYLVHRDSVVSVEAAGHYMDAVAALVRESSDAER